MKHSIDTREEIRDGYTVSEKQKKIWSVEIDLLKELLRVCEKHDIKVFVFAGTLLGAIRHKGFIPWDDDIDVAMLKDDFEKLVQIAPYEFSHPYFFQTALTDRKYYIGYARLRNSETTGLVRYENSPDYNNGIFIDIFLLNGYTHSRIGLKKQLFDLSFSEKFIRAYYDDLTTRKGFKKLIMWIVQRVETKLVSYETLIQWNHNILCRYDECENRVTLLTHGKRFLFNCWCQTDDLKEITYVPFENIMVPIPKEYDKFLTTRYGNYMQFPPESERGKWHENVIRFDPETPYKIFIERMHHENNTK